MRDRGSTISLVTAEQAGIVVGSQWDFFENGERERVTVLAIEPDNTYPVSYQWSDGVEGAQSVLGFIEDFRPASPVAWLGRVRAAALAEAGGT